ncbi:MAG: hypothetical protein V2J55_17505 [Candidatus Competibacteraceae bacterium]|jgi:hypothetical protein|nr:hypothetical protein [Candidatus Competibacteraceae bacterium]
MSESIAAVQAIAEATLRQEQWTSPSPPQATDTAQFEATLEAPAEADIVPPVDDIVVTEPTGKAGEFSDKLMNGIVQMDQNYQKIMDRLFEWPSFRTYLQQQSPSAGADQVVHHNTLDTGINPSADFDTYMDKTIATDITADTTPIHHSNLNTDETAAAIEEFSDRLHAIQERNKATYEAGLEYSGESTRWYLSTEFWLTKVRILTSAVSQTSQGLTTLFRSGG